jgi:6-pyruvoyltetrahydropterin/6-carboxytetrahydropterin synthase
MNYELSQRFYFESAQTLARDVDAAPSQRVHGHTYLCEVTVSNPPDPATGMVIDLGFLRQVVERARLGLDHHLLNEVEGLSVPTLENLCAYLWRSMEAELPSLLRLTIRREASGDSCSLVR